jgi:cation diffusion facilitator family transporter
MSASSKKVVYAALAGNTLIAITKFAAAAFTGSSAMLAEGIHSVVDTGNQALLLYGMRRAERPPDERFPFGHGKELYFWSFVVAILIFAGGAGLSAYEGVVHLMHPEPMSNALVNYVVLGLAMVFEGSAWTIALKEFRRVKGPWGYVEAVRRGKNPTFFVVLFEDSAAMIGLLIAAAGIALSDVTGNPIFDGIASVLIGCVLAATAVWLAYETKGLLIGESANKRVVDGIRQLVLDHDRIDHVNEVLTMHMGPDFVLVNLGVQFDDDADATEIEDIVCRLDHRIKEHYPEVKRVFIEAEAWRKAPQSTE